MRSGNPILRKDIFKSEGSHFSDVMTIEGTVNKTFFLFFLLVLSAFFVWNKPFVYLLYVPEISTSAFIVALITVFKKDWSPITSIIYAILEGVLIGIISAIFEQAYQGIVLQAFLLTLGTLFSMLMIYKFKLIQVTEHFKLGVFAATGSIFLIYWGNMIMGFYGSQMSGIHENGWKGIAFSVVVIIIAAFNFVLDFDFIEKGSESEAPKYMEWYSAFGLLITLIWLYLEILRLLVKAIEISRNK